MQIIVAYSIYPIPSIVLITQGTKTSCMPKLRHNAIEVSLVVAPRMFFLLYVRNPTTQSNGNSDFAFPKSSKPMLVICDSDLEFSTLSLRASVTIYYER